MSQQAVLFDLDGTLLDSAPDLIDCLKQALLAHNLTLPNYDFRSIISHGAKAMVAVAMDKPIDSPEIYPIWQAFLNRYDTNCYTHSCLFSGVQTVLKTLEIQQIPWGIVTNKSRRFFDEILKKEPLLQTAKIGICPEDVAVKKPDPEGILLACDFIKAQPKNCWYVGDHKKDLLAGQAAGCQLAFATYGYLDQEHQTMDINCVANNIKLLNQPLDFLSYI